MSSYNDLIIQQSNMITELQESRKQKDILLEKQDAAIKELQARVVAAEHKGHLWTAFCRMSSLAREELCRRYTNAYDLAAQVSVVATRPIPVARYPGNDEKLYEEAGHAADEYRGGGWMMLRQLLVDFHKNMTHRGI